MSAALFALDDAACERLAEERGTPLFAYDGPTARACYDRLRRALPERVRLAYAVKSNPHPELLWAFADLGASFDCASLGELRRVAELGISGDRIFFAGPGKRTRELELALDLGARVQAEGWEDLERLDRLARGELAVNLRVHPASGVQEEQHILGGTGPSAFGIDEEDVEAVLQRAATLRHVRVRGLHVFAATNQRDANKLLATYRMVFGLGHRLASDPAIELEQIDLGGGMGVPYTADEKPLDVDALGRGLDELLGEEDWFQGEAVVEPGRLLSAPCGVYLARVVRVKESRGVRFAILEGGINHLLRPLLTTQPFPVKSVGGSGEPLEYTLTGPLCTSLDRLGDAVLPSLEPGDLLAFGMTGAYGFTEGMTHFLSHPVPPEVWVD